MDSALDEADVVIPEGSDPVVTTPTNPQRVGGEPTSRVGEGEGEVDGTRVTTKADTPTVRLRRSLSLSANRRQMLCRWPDVREVQMKPERVLAIT